MENQNGSLKHKKARLLHVKATLFQYNLCSPVKRVVAEHLACYVEAFKDVEGGDHRQSRVWGWGGHDVVTYRCTPTRQQNKIENQGIRQMKALLLYCSKACWFIFILF